MNDTRAFQRSTLFSSLTELQQEAISLFQQDQFESCEILARLDWSSKRCNGNGTVTTAAAAAAAANSANSEQQRNNNSNELNTELRHNNSNERERVDIYLLAECCYRQDKWAAAKSFYELLLTTPTTATTTHSEHHQQHPQEHQNEHPQFELLPLTNDYWCANTNIPLNNTVVRYKVACCSQKMGHLIEAVCALEAIPISSRSLAVHMLLGTLYVATSNMPSAEASYLRALEQNPCCLQAVHALAAFGTDKAPIAAALDAGQAHRHHHQRNPTPPLSSDSNSSTNHTNTTNNDSNPCSLVSKELVLLLTAKHRHQTALALQHAQKLSMEYPNNVQLMLLQAELSQQSCCYTSSTTSTTTTTGLDSSVMNIGLGDEDGNIVAEDLFSRVHAREPANTLGMDQFANLLGQAGKLHELSDLTDSMLQVDDKAPESWTCLALYHKYQGSKNNNNNTNNGTNENNNNTNHSASALKFVDKAIALDQRHAYAHFIRGTLLLQDHRPEYAANSFFRSNEIQPAVATYEGLVDAYLAAGKDKEAIAASKSAYNLAPRDPRTQTLVGLALAQGSAAQAKRSLNKALQVSPTLARPLFCLVELLRLEKDYSQCIDLLQRALDSLTNSSMFSQSSSYSGSSESLSRSARQDDILCRMGAIYSAMEQYKDSIHCYDRALTFNPNCSPAIQALDRLEKLMRGIDPNDNSEDIVEDNDTAATDTGSNSSPAATYRPSY